MDVLKLRFVFFQVLKRDLAKALDRKRPHFSQDGFILHQDNAPAHSSQEAQLTATFQLDAEILPHPPYSPDLAPCDFALFPKLKSELKGKRFQDFHELQQEAQTLMYSYPVVWYENVFRKWVERHRRCVAERGAYFEKS